MKNNFEEPTLDVTQFTAKDEVANNVDVTFSCEVEEWE